MTRKHPHRAEIHNSRMAAPTSTAHTHAKQRAGRGGGPEGRVPRPRGTHLGTALPKAQQTA